MRACVDTHLHSAVDGVAGQSQCKKNEIYVQIFCHSISGRILCIRSIIFRIFREYWGLEAVYSNKNLGAFGEYIWLGATRDHPPQTCPSHHVMTTVSSLCARSAESIPNLQCGQRKARRPQCAAADGPRQISSGSTDFGVPHTPSEPEAVHVSRACDIRVIQSSASCADVDQARQDPTPGRSDVFFSTPRVPRRCIQVSAVTMAPGPAMQS